MISGRIDLQSFGNDHFKVICSMFGSAILGAFAGGWVYRVGTGRAPIFRWQPTPAISLLFVAIGVALALRGRGLLFRGAWLAFVAQQLLFVVPGVSARAEAGGWLNALLVVSAVLLVAAGTTHRRPKTVAAVVAIFIFMAAGRILTLTYEDRFLGNRSVVGLLQAVPAISLRTA